MKNKLNSEVFEKNLQKIMAIIERKKVMPMQKAAGVSIRDILVMSKKKGEFNFYSNISESESVVIERVFAHITDLALKGCEKHYHDHFNIREEGTSIEYYLKEGHEHQVTRIITSEFTFYTRSKDGPLSINGFQNLLQKITEGSHQFPINLHLALGTFPVKTKDNGVNNVVIYVQCGQRPKINVLIKAFNSQLDPCYPGTINLDYTDNRFLETLQQKLITFQTNLLYLSHHASVETLTKEFIRYLEKLPSDLFIDRNFNLKELISLMNNLAIENKINNKNTFLIKSLSDFKALVDQEIKNLTKKKFHRTLALMALSNECQKNHAMVFGGQINCQTAGGAVFRTAIDICLDHKNNTAKNALEYEFYASYYVAPIALPEYVSQIIISNTILIEQQGLLSETKLVSYADPNNTAFAKYEISNVLPDNNCNDLGEIEERGSVIFPAFGLAAEYVVYKPRLVEQFNKEILSIVKSHNEILLRREAYKHYITQHPQEKDQVEALMAKDPLLIPKNVTKPLLRSLIKVGNVMALDQCLQALSADRIQEKFATGETLLLLAINTKNIATVKLLLPYFDLSIDSGYHLYASVNNDCIEIATLLINYGANIKGAMIFATKKSDNVSLTKLVELEKEIARKKSLQIIPYMNLFSNILFGLDSKKQDNTTINDANIFPKLH